MPSSDKIPYLVSVFISQSQLHPYFKTSNIHTVLLLNSFRDEKLNILTMDLIKSTTTKLNIAGDAHAYVFVLRDGL